MQDWNFRFISFRTTYVRGAGFSKHGNVLFEDLHPFPNVTIITTLGPKFECQSKLVAEHNFQAPFVTLDNDFGSICHAAFDRRGSVEHVVDELLAKYCTQLLAGTISKTYTN